MAELPRRASTKLPNSVFTLKHHFPQTTLYKSQKKTSNTNSDYLQTSRDLQLLLHKKPTMIHVEDLKPKLHREAKSFILI